MPKLSIISLRDGKKRTDGPTKCVEMCYFYCFIPCYISKTKVTICLKGSGAIYGNEPFL